MDFKKYLNEVVLNKANEKGVFTKYDETKDGNYYFVDFNGNLMKLSGDAFKKGYLRFEKQDIQSLLEAEYNQEQEAYDDMIERISKEAQQQIEENDLAKKIQFRVNYGNRLNGVYKANFCDGNISGKFNNCDNWYKAPCSKKCMEKNAKHGGPNCSKRICSKYVNGTATEKDIKELEKNKELCYESHIFTDYEISAGYSGEYPDITPNGWSLEDDRVVLLTTREPGKREEERIIFGVFMVDKVYPMEAKKPARATSYPECRIALTYDEAKHFKYWEYSGPNKDGSIGWQERLLRYQTDNVCARVLIDIVELMKKTRTPNEVAYAEAFLNKYLKMIGKPANQIPQKNGALLSKQKNN